ncbi:biotin--[acetyl-CoA-carboxylase] ligase [Campylobacter sp. 7477a]|uniref:biotin--[acetyl-CoA-carboxylase] ligase n=1 Tax=Campylobacter sp. 7477a TaxID=2735741 RepID=UPI0030143046|nr:biotin--[acetyl-CoA-carboxylase] ligase [Campylobacter sp. 7477a]
MVIEFLEECASTHNEITQGVRVGVIKPPFAMCAKTQTAGVGSRGNKWIGLEGNLFLSFCLHKNALPDDLNDASISIYFSMIMKNFLENLGSKIWVKWPNDFYVNDLKIGGTISTKIGEIYIGSIGLNLARAPQNTGVLDIKTTPNDVVWGFCDKLEEKIPWKQIFSKFKIEFERSKSFITHINGEIADLSAASLCEDGSILLDNKKVYSLR